MNMILCICMHYTSCITCFIQFTHQFHMSSWEIEEQRPIEAGSCTLPTLLLGVTYWCRGLVGLGFCQERFGDGIGSWQVCCYQWLIAMVQIGCTCDDLKTDNNLGLVMVELLTDSRWAGWAGLFCIHSFYPHFCRLIKVMKVEATEVLCRPCMLSSEPCVHMMSLVTAQTGM